MKKVVLMIIPALICGVMLSGCGSDKVEPQDESTSGELYVIGAKSGSAMKADNKTDLLFTGDDIVSFNIVTGKFVFTETKLDEILTSVSHHDELHFFIDDKPVFTPPIRINIGWKLSSIDDCELQFRTNGDVIFLTDMHVHFDTLSLSNVEKELFIAKKEKRDAELDVLIEYLREAGKIVEREIELPEILRTGCDILYFADSTKFENRTINWTINDTRITGLYPAGTDLSDITPIVIVSVKASVNPKAGEKADFSNEKEVTYTVTAEDGTQKIYKAQAKLE